MFWLLLMLLIALVVCSWRLPGSALEESAWSTFSSSVHLLSRGANDDAEGMTGSVTAGSRAAEREALSPDDRTRARDTAAALGKTAAIRKRVTPLMAKRVAVRYAF